MDQSEWDIYIETGFIGHNYFITSPAFHVILVCPVSVCYENNNDIITINRQSTECLYIRIQYMSDCACA
jgi:hypothetical protein